MSISNSSAELSREQSAAAAALVLDLLASSPTVSAADGQAATVVVSAILETQALGGGVTAEVANSLQSALVQLTRILPEGNSTSTTLTSKNLNVSVAHRTAEQLTEPVLCPTAGAPIAASFPSSLYDTIAGIDVSAPVSVLLYSAAVNLHAEGPSPPASPLVSLTLLQQGVELHVVNAPSPINISLPLTAATDGADAGVGSQCAGRAAALAAGCSSALECRWWDTVQSNWSTAGCATVPVAGGSVGCSCDHLTDFIAFELRLDRLGDDLLAGFDVNLLTADALHCLLHSSPSALPTAYALLIALMVMAITLIAQATSRDADEVAMVESLVAGRKRERKARLWRLFLSVEGGGRRGSMRPGLFMGSVSRLSSTRQLGSMARLSTRRFSRASARQLPAAAMGGMPTAMMTVEVAEGTAPISANTCDASLLTRKGGNCEAKHLRRVSFPQADAACMAGTTPQPPPPADQPPADPPPPRLKASESTISDVDVSESPASSSCRAPAQLASSRRSWTSGTELVTPAAVPDSVDAVEAIEQADLAVWEDDTGGLNGSKPAPLRDPHAPQDVVHGMQLLEIDDDVSDEMLDESGTRLGSAQRGSTVTARQASLSKGKHHAEKWEAAAAGMTEKLPLVSQPLSQPDWLAAKVADVERAEGAEGEVSYGDTEMAYEEAALRIQRFARLKCYARRFHNASALSTMPPPLLQLRRSSSNAASALARAVRGALNMRRRSSTYRAQLRTRGNGSSAKHWRKARNLKTQVVIVRRWHSDVDSCGKRMLLAFQGGHTLVAGVFCRGSLGLTRAETVMILMNSLCLELVVLCMFYSGSGSDGPLVINPITIISGGLLAAIICIPGMVFFSWLFMPHHFVELARGLARACLWPAKFTLRCCTTARRLSKPAAAHRRFSACQVTPVSAAGDASIIRSEQAAAMATAVGVPVAGRSLRGGHEPGRQTRSDSFSHFSYASLNEHMLRHSLRRTLKMRDGRAVARILFGWGGNWLAFFALLAAFMLYACEFGTFDSSSKVLLLSWLWSIGQRFIVNEPLLIGLAKGLPMLFSSPVCANLCSESCVNVLAVISQVIVSICKVLTRGA